MHMIVKELKGGRDMMSTFTTVIHIANVFIIFVPPFIIKKICNMTN